MRTPKNVWVIFDPMDGPHLFKSKKEAQRVHEKWGRDASSNPHDSWWDMSEPVEYVRKENGCP